MARATRIGLPALTIASLGFSAAVAQENVVVFENPTTVDGITTVAGIRVGHFTYPDANTGCTVVIADGGATGGVDVRGGAPGTAETDLLDPVNTVQEVNAVVLSGGSAFGLAARHGVMRYLEERGEGYRVGGGLVVPIVPAAIIFDLGLSGGVRPGPDCGYEAAAGRLRRGRCGGERGRGRRRHGGEDAWDGHGHEGRGRHGLGDAGERPHGRGDRSRQRGRRRDRPGNRACRGGEHARRTVASPTRAASCAASTRPADRARTRRSASSRPTRGLTQAEVNEGGADGAGRAGARHRAGAHAKRRRHGVLAGNRGAHDPASAPDRWARSRPRSWPTPSCARCGPRTGCPRCPPCVICLRRHERNPRGAAPLRRPHHGWWDSRSGRRVSGTRDFFVAGRALGPGLLFATLLAANIGAGSTVNAAGLGYQHGHRGLVVGGVGGRRYAGAGLLAGPAHVACSLGSTRCARSATTSNSATDPRCARQWRCCSGSARWPSWRGQLIAMAWILEVVAGAPRWLGAVVGGLVMTVYFMAGGLLSSAWVNLVQLVVLMCRLSDRSAAGAGGGRGTLGGTRARPGRHRDTSTS